MGHLVTILQKNRIIAQDGFNRENGALGKANTGQTWTSYTIAPSIVNNKFSAVGGVSDYIAVLETNNSNIDLRANLNNNVSMYGAWLIFRASDLNNFWFTRVNSTGELQLYKKVAGILNLAASNAGGYPTSVENLIRVKASDSTIKVSINGVEIISINDSALQSNTKHGLNTTNTTAVSTADNFIVEGF